MSVFVQHLKENGRLKEVEIKVCIIGSRKLSAKDDFWRIFAPNLTIYGFDADPDACEAANTELESRQINWTEKHIPLALSQSIGESQLYVTKAVHCSSLYPPNEDYLNRFRGMKEGIQLDFTVDIETTTLDDFCQSEGIKEIDFIQVDVQGADLDVLKGAAKILEHSILGVKIEVEFSSMYVNQPLFSDIDVYLRTRDFLLFDLITDDNWCRRPRANSPIYSSTNGGQLLWADALYFRDPLLKNASVILKSPSSILKLACLADVMGYPDYGFELLEYLTVNYGANPRYNLAQEIVESLSKFPELVAQGLDSLPIVANIRDRL